MSSTSSSRISAGVAALLRSSETWCSSSFSSGSWPSLAFVSSHSLDTFFTSANDSCSCRSMSASACSCFRRSRVSSCSCRSNSAIFSSKLFSAPSASAALASRRASTCSLAPCRQRSTAFNTAEMCCARTEPATPGCGVGILLAPANASNWTSRSVFGTSLPFSTSDGSKSGTTPRSPLTASAMCWKRASRSLRSSGQSVGRSGGKPVEALRATVTSKMNFGGGLASSSLADFLVLSPQSLSQRMSCPRSASVVSGVSCTSEGSYCRSGFRGSDAGRLARHGSVMMTSKLSQYFMDSSGTSSPAARQLRVLCSTIWPVGPSSMDARRSTSSTFSWSCFCTMYSILTTSSKAAPSLLSALSAFSPSPSCSCVPSVAMLLARACTSAMPTFTDSASMLASPRHCDSS
mmetsp:Transcript_33763/g.86501  ORF Transcript_33763/g.86501 Transcript_33763/m.86501 type:complete len:405 (+) Transcript_33763:667-1881(+)